MTYPGQDKVRLEQAKSNARSPKPVSLAGRPIDDQYPSTPGYRDTDTSRAAARASAPNAERLRDTVLQHIRASGAAGMTADEVADQMHMTAFSIRPRVSELNKMRAIKKSDGRRKNDSGCSAIVWVLNHE